ncbi:hypothetical protein M569_07341, partial [Genlisea aurea]
VYHERQKLQYCLMHALNNLFQQKQAFTRSALNAIAENLDDPAQSNWNPLSRYIFRPHHNEVTGNYDVNVLIAALEGRGKTVVWHDKRSGGGSVDLDQPSLLGIILNVPVAKYGSLWSGRHWIALRKIGNVWYNLDSDLLRPLPYADVLEVRHFLEATVAAGGELFVVREKE